ncbi:MAG: carboxy terminal-processing peptidase [Chlorobiaceae bacterium]
MVKKSTLLLLFLLWGASPLAAVTPAKAKAPASAAVTLRPTEIEEDAAKYLTSYLLQAHYRKVAVNDSLSREIFKRYIDNLDGRRSYFVAGEVESLRKLYGTTLDDEFLAGKTNAGFAIYNFFLKRAKEKMRFMKAAADTVRFDFSKPEAFSLDRKLDPWPADRQQLVSQWKKELKYQWLNLKYSGESPASIRTALAKSFSSRLNLLNRSKPDDAFQAYIYALTTSFDPHTSYFSPDEYENFQIDMSRSLEGIGAKLQTEGEYTLVNEIIPGGPAFRGDLLKKGDKIVGVGQGKTGEIVDVTAWRIIDVVKLIRGKKGTVVRLKILPASQGGRGPSKTLEIVRDKVTLEEQAAKKSIIDDNGEKIGVITIPSFYLDFEGQQRNTGNYTSTSRDVKRILGELNLEHVAGIVIDLRNNGGGSLEEAVNVTGLFIPSGPVVQVSNSSGRSSVLNDEDSREQYSGPLAVLVNRYSASASEIFAAAIQDYGRGVIIGERTFGKGTVQSIIKLTRPIKVKGKSPDLGEIKLTIAKFYRISGESTQHKGVVPDIVMPSMIDTATIGEDTYTSSLPWTTISKAPFHPLLDVTAEDIATLRQKEQFRSSKNPLFQEYRRDLTALEEIRRKKVVSLQDADFKSEIEAIKKIEKQWIQTPSAAGTATRDVLLQESAGVVRDLGSIKSRAAAEGEKGKPALN